MVNIEMPEAIGFLMEQNRLSLEKSWAIQLLEMLFQNLLRFTEGEDLNTEGLKMENKVLKNTTAYLLGWNTIRNPVCKCGLR